MRSTINTRTNVTVIGIRQDRRVVAGIDSAHGLCSAHLLSLRLALPRLGERLAVIKRTLKEAYSYAAWRAGSRDSLSRGLLTPYFTVRQPALAYVRQS